MLVHPCSWYYLQQPRDRTSPSVYYGWLDKQNVVYTYNAMSFSLEKEGNSDPGFSMCELWWCWGRKKFSSTPLGSSGQSKNSIDRRQINRRKSNKSLITHIHGRDPEELTHQNGQSPHLKYHLELIQKRMLRVIVGISMRKKPDKQMLGK